MKKNLAIAVLTILCVSMAAYQFLLTERVITVEISKKMIQAQINSRLPLEKSVLGLKFAVHEPVMEFQEKSGRVLLGLSAAISVGDLLKNVGSIRVSGRVYYQPEAGEFYFIMPKVEDITVIAVPDKYEFVAQYIFEALANEYLSRYSVYSLKESDKKQALVKSRLKYISVKEDGLVVVFEQ